MSVHDPFVVHGIVLIAVVVIIAASALYSWGGECEKCKLWDCWLKVITRTDYQPPYIITRSYLVKVCGNCEHVAYRGQTNEQKRG